MITANFSLAQISDLFMISASPELPGKNGIHTIFIFSFERLPLSGGNWKKPFYFAPFHPRPEENSSCNEEEMAWKEWETTDGSWNEVKRLSSTEVLIQYASSEGGKSYHLSKSPWQL